jgi:hypothetical protein
LFGLTIILLITGGGKASVDGALTTGRERTRERLNVFAIF